jgi:hypothetical protein
LRHQTADSWITYDRCHKRRESRKIRDHDYCRACYPIMLGLPNVAIGRSWLPLEPFPNLIAATRWHRPDFWGDFAIGFLHELPMSLADNTETVAQLLPHLTSLSELPTPLKRHEPQLRVALEALKYDHRSLAGVAATLQQAYEFQQWHRESQALGFKTDSTGVTHGGLR